jgi:hypothetical protein
METLQSTAGTFFRAIPTPLYRWMTNVPYSFILVSLLASVRSLLESNWGIQTVSQFIGAAAAVYFILAYANHFVIPQIQDWNKLDPNTQHSSITSWIVVSIFLFLFIQNGILSSSQDFLIHSCIAFLFASLFHVNT